ncbi:hypothetical protein [Phosphitispora fastidiosa]|uniref:hypothetical protein n=1 Tax=Phosphitispora fastidiosa TaxID=2837202 RepID=UPI001E36A92C|nr:hypothetical protein [Phosphitispora fastidiosa]MBU7006328.1 hypothetical protein [Phosphitispora fastidiosa]
MKVTKAKPTKIAKAKKPDTNHYLTAMADLLGLFRKLNQVHAIEISGVNMQVTCPFCGLKNFSISLRTMSGSCNCGKKMVDVQDGFEKYYLLHFEQNELRESKKNSAYRRMMEKPVDIIY